MYLHNNKEKLSKCLIFKPNFSWYTVGQRGFKMESPHFHLWAHKHGDV